MESRRGHRDRTPYKESIPEFIALKFEYKVHTCTEYADGARLVPVDTPVALYIYVYTI